MQGVRRAAYMGLWRVCVGSGSTATFRAKDVPSFAPVTNTFCGHYSGDDGLGLKLLGFMFPLFVTQLTRLAGLLAWTVNNHAFDRPERGIGSSAPPPFRTNISSRWPIFRG